MLFRLTPETPVSSLLIVVTGEVGFTAFRPLVEMFPIAHQALAPARLAPMSLVVIMVHPQVMANLMRHRPSNLIRKGLLSQAIVHICQSLLLPDSCN